MRLAVPKLQIPLPHIEEPVYPGVIALALVAFPALDVRVKVVGGEHIPRTGAAVLASNHVSYLDFIFAGWGARPSKRLVRFMAKEAVFTHPVSGPLMRGMKHIPVDREAGSQSYRDALAALRKGEIVGVFPEATISRSFTVKEIKSGAVRMALATKAPLIPMAVWGAHRMWTKGRPKNLVQRHVPINVYVGEPLRPTRGDDPNEVTATLKVRMQELLDRAQAEYPDAPRSEDDRWWQPAHLGGSAPTPEQARLLDGASDG